MSIEELLEALERYVRESAEGDRKVAMAQHSCLMAGTTLLLAGGFQFSEDPERGEIARRAELDREQRPTRLQARQYGWSYADQARA
jgi:hypothetical protein